MPVLASIHICTYAWPDLGEHWPNVTMICLDLRVNNMILVLCFDMVIRSLKRRCPLNSLTPLVDTAATRSFFPGLI